MGFNTGSINSGLKDPDDDGYEFWRALRAIGEETLMSLWRLYFTSALWMFFMAGMRNRVVLCRSTNTSFPTAMDSIRVDGW